MLIFNYMSKLKKIAIILAVLFVALLIFSFLAGSIINFLVPPSEALSSDSVVEDIGGDNALVATLEGCVEVGREDIPHETFKTRSGRELQWSNARNISFVDTSGRTGNMIVWKDSPDNYEGIPANNNVSYISDYLEASSNPCFLVHFPEKNSVYGIIVVSDEISYLENNLLYSILDLNSSEFPATYTQPSSSSSYSYNSGSSHYHTVVPDRYTLSRTDPGAYYDHYEYGDNYDIDDYLESEGYD